MNARIVALIFVLLPLVAMSSEPASYLCVGDQAVGFRYDKTEKKWEHAIFNTDDQKFLYKVDSGGNWVFELFGKPKGEGVTPTVCEDFKDKNGKPGIVSCRGLYSSDFNLITGRFMSTYMAGYTEKTDATDNDDDTPLLTIGRCSKV